MLKHDQSEMQFAARPATPKSAVIAFEPEHILRAICFHLLDDHHAATISALSVHHTRDRLRRQRVRLSIARRQWEAMSNRERLEWLLGQSRTVTLYSGQIVSLAPQK
jgi:hypothetical protein